MTLHQHTFQVNPPATIVAPLAAVSPMSVVELSGPMPVDLQIYKGDTGRFRITVTDGIDPVDISAATWDADIRTTASSASSIGSFTVEPVVGDDSSVDVILTETVSNLLGSPNYVYDVEMRLAGEVITLIAGKITVTGDVSRP